MAGVNFEDKSFADLLGLLYEAAAAPGRWPSVVDALSTQLRGEAYVFESPSGRVDDPRALILRGHATSEAGAPPLEAWHHDLVRRATGWCGILERDLAPGSGETRRGGMAAVLRNEPGQRLALLGVGALDGRFGDSDLERLRLVSPHVAYALRIAEERRAAAASEEATAVALDLLPIGVLMLDRNRRVQRTNLAARQILNADRGLALVANELIARSAEGREQLGRTLESATSDGRSAAATIPIDDDATQSLALFSVPLAPHAAERDATVALLFVADQQSIELDRPSIAEMYRLTPAEADVACLLSSGLSTAEIARRRQVHADTVRAQLKQIFVKTDCRNQADLVRLILTSPARMNRNWGDVPFP